MPAVGGPKAYAVDLQAKARRRPAAGSRSSRSGLYHDIIDRVEDELIDVNVEAVLTPSLPALWGVVRPALGASINTAGDTSHV
jgi:hypothetical protein